MSALNVLVKVLKESYLLYSCLDSFEICTVVRYWSKFIQSATRFSLSDLEVKVKVKVIDFDSDGTLFHNVC